jgi:hypothetical protein
MDLSKCKFIGVRDTLGLIPLPGHHHHVTLAVNDSCLRGRCADGDPPFFGSTRKAEAMVGRLYWTITGVASTISKLPILSENSILEPCSYGTQRIGFDSSNWQKQSPVSSLQQKLQQGQSISTFPPSGPPQSAKKEDSAMSKLWQTEVGKNPVKSFPSTRKVTEETQTDMLRLESCHSEVQSELQIHWIFYLPRVRIPPRYELTVPLKRLSLKMRSPFSGKDRSCKMVDIKRLS